MKFLQIFNKTPNHKRFNFPTRFYDPQEEERKERELRMQQELLRKEVEVNTPEEFGHRDRIAGSFRQAKKTVNVQADPSANFIRLVVVLIIVLGLIAYLQYGNVALYGVAAVFIPFYLYLKFRKIKR